MLKQRIIWVDPQVHSESCIAECYETHAGHHGCNALSGHSLNGDKRRPDRHRRFGRDLSIILIHTVLLIFQIQTMTA